MGASARAGAAPRILFVDDHPAIRRGLQGILADAFNGAEFGHATNTEEALERARTAQWDVAILDLNLPGKGGLSLIRSLKDEFPDVAILVYSVHAEEQFGIRAIQAGASGYLSKDRPPEEIVNAVLKLLRGGQYVTAELAAAMMGSLSERTPGLHRLLSDRETQVLRMLAAGKSPSEIGSELTLSAKTVSTYRARVLEKLNLRTNADLVRYAIEHGIIE